MTTLLDLIIDAAPITLVEAQAILAAIKEPVMKVADQWDGFAAAEIAGCFPRAKSVQTARND